MKQRKPSMLLEVYLPLNPITIGTLLELFVHNIRTASFGGSSVVVVVVVVVVVATEVVEVTVGKIFSHSNDSHGHPVGQLSLIPVQVTYKVLRFSWPTSHGQSSVFVLKLSTQSASHSPLSLQL